MSRKLLFFLCCIILSAGLFVVAWLPAGAQEENSPSWRFGVIESYESPEHADRLNVGWTRIPFNWAEIQQGGPQTWTARVSDEQIKAEKAAGRLPVGLLIGIPEWARDESRLPAGLWLSHDNPNNLWANFVREGVSRYQGDIDHWIIWNEPDIGDTEIAHTWDGTVADFAQLQRTAYRVAKETNPDAVLHLAAFTYWADYYAGTEQYMARLLDNIRTDPQAAQYNFYFDVATAHLYFQPNQIHDLLNLFTSIMRERGLGQPIWLVETNAPPKDDPAWPVPNWTLSVTQNEQATFIPQALAAALAAGAERVAVYKLIDTEQDRLANPEPFGLVRQDGSERPAFATYRIAIDYLSEAYRAERERWNEVGQIRVDQPDRTISVLFARLPQWQQAQVTATDDTAVLVDMWGTKEVITPTMGIYSIDLPPARCSQSIGDYCMIGGPTYYLVQSADVAPPTATPMATATPTPTILPTFAPTSKATDPPLATPAIQVTSPSELASLPEETAGPALAGTETPNQEIQALELPGYWMIAGGVIVIMLLGTIFVATRRRF
ncbi:MAG TPA: hypothetical protein DEP47_08340 [Chloroflexi bacterium]|nr:hypothetical protein [Chloroflexota bacterium]